MTTFLNLPKLSSCGLARKTVLLRGLDCGHFKQQIHAAKNIHTGEEDKARMALAEVNNMAMDCRVGVLQVTLCNTEVQ